jgi:hypothetical protein
VEKIVEGLRRIGFRRRNRLGIEKKTTEQRVGGINFFLQALTDPEEGDDRPVLIAGNEREIAAMATLIEVLEDVQVETGEKMHVAEDRDQRWDLSEGVRHFAFGGAAYFTKSGGSRR